MENTIVTSSSPHIRDTSTTSGIMLDVIIALIPASLFGIYLAGARALALIITCVVAALLTEVIFLALRRRPFTIGDGSAAVTGLLLALTLPPDLPLWTAVLGAIVAISIGKQIFGGLGSNPFNPALVGRAFMVISFPVLMTTWRGMGAPLDGVSSATPLGLWLQRGVTTSYWQLFTGLINGWVDDSTVRAFGCIGEASALALLIGVIYLFYRKVLDWRIPFSYIGAVLLLTFIFGEDPIFHLFSGGLILGAFFMATDYVTTPVTKGGRIIFGLGAGLILVIIRLYAAFDEGVLFSILFMNMLVPIIDRYTRPRIFGEVRG